MLSSLTCACQLSSFPLHICLSFNFFILLCGKWHLKTAYLDEVVRELGRAMRRLEIMEQEQGLAEARSKIKIHSYISFHGRLK